VSIVHNCRLTDTRLNDGATAEVKLERKNRHGLPGMRFAMILSMNFAFGLLILASGSLPAIAYQLGRSPEGFEDETGFHFSSSTGNLLSEESDLQLGQDADVRTALFKAQSNVSRRRETRDSIGVAIPRIREAH
jgi:hypothetical protein